MQVIVRLREGDALPDNLTVLRILQTELEPYGSGTATRRIDTILARDDRYWLTLPEKLADPLGSISAHVDGSSVDCATSPKQKLSGGGGHG